MADAVSPKETELRDLAKKMGDAGYCNYAACEEYLRLAFEAGERKERERCASLAGGWTGEVNTVENCAVVSEVCRQIARAIRGGESTT